MFLLGLFIPRLIFAQIFDFPLAENFGTSERKLRPGEVLMTPWKNNWSFVSSKFPPLRRPETVPTQINARHMDNTSQYCERNAERTVKKIKPGLFFAGLLLSLLQRRRNLLGFLKFLGKGRFCCSCSAVRTDLAASSSFARRALCCCSDNKSNLVSSD